MQWIYDILQKHHKLNSSIFKKCQKFITNKMLEIKSQHLTLAGPMCPVFFCFSIWDNNFCSSSFSNHEANYYIPTRKSLSSSSRLHLNRFDNENLERKMSDEAMASRRRPQHAFGRSVLTFTISRPCNLKCSSESPSTQHHCVVESELKKCISTLHLYRDLLYCSSTHILVFWWSQNKALVLGDEVLLEYLVKPKQILFKMVKGLNHLASKKFLSCKILNFFFLSRIYTSSGGSASSAVATASEAGRVVW